MIKALRGMNDLMGYEAELFAKIVRVCESVARNYGFELIETPKLEQTALFRRSVGESSDIVGKEMYEFSDKSGDSVCLRPEGTAGVVRSFIENKFDKAGGVRKFYYTGSMFRYERPQRGRLREFHQFGVECFGEGSVYEDASVILLLAEILRKLGVKTTLKLNSLGDSSCMPEYKNKLIKFLNEREDRLCEDCKRRIITNPIRVLDCKNEACQSELATAPLITDNLSDECKGEFEKLQEILLANGLNFEIDKRLVRGLDYYCKTAFEFVSSELGAQSAVGGGGRYDRLVEFLGGKSTFGVGFAIGIERLIEILKLKETPNSRNGIYIGAMDEAIVPCAFAIGQKLRAITKTHIAYEPKNLQKHLKSADSKMAKFCLCIGEDEFKNASVWCKNLEDKSQDMVKFNEIEDFFKDRV
ncbi:MULTISPECIES: histidine--tRNA ligase [unclassified Campylobacter]|uniref:histidine--tRNA ligase n=1 Tax=unclassified Campylobacter TaxID=2593542 RepID=UPI0022E9DAB9|nr:MULTISPECIES: histidine--tRNA ligase [unclassified Campylobacter]MDA3047383.1 histidine--tRNA ligase [Campylobacter sp. JMF_08 NE1]MDA3061565.1 histidine--tRNA ligase [Campylobacter sp. JMF_14 EL1]MDA3073329.1 histidine--tRNA ligase [Campylobacter sp. JMF_10 EL2]